MTQLGAPTRGGQGGGSWSGRGRERRGCGTQWEQRSRDPLGLAPRATAAPRPISLPPCPHPRLPLPPGAEPFEHWFYIHEWAPLIIFFGTYLGIVRNKKIPHVARYHIMMVRRRGAGRGGAAARLRAVARTGR